MAKTAESVDELLEKYTRDNNLQEAVDHVRASGKFELIAKDADVVAVFAAGKPPKGREAASCRRIPGPIRVVTSVEFVLVFWRKVWDAMTLQQRHTLIIHEVNHMTADKDGRPRLRPHSGNFCEIPEHDTFSTDLGKQIPMSPALRKFDRQQGMEEVPH